jgi:hypothetical protein
MSGSESVYTNASSVSRYDLVLAVIPCAYLSSILVERLLAVDLHVGLTVASLVGTLALLDAVLINPPRGPGTGEGSA